MRLLAIWIINALALLALPYVVPSVHVASFGTALIVALVLGLINALLFQLAGYLIDGFNVGGFWPALLGSVVYSVISWALSAVFLSAKGK